MPRIAYSIASCLIVVALGMMSESESEADIETELEEGTVFGNIVEAVVAFPELSSLVDAVTASGLVDTLANPELVATVFAPTNSAFSTALSALGITFEALANDTQTLTDILLYHVVPVKALSTDLMDGMTLTTLAKGNLTVALSNNVVIEAVGSSATVILPDLIAGKGVVHVINNVLLPF